MNNSRILELDGLRAFAVMSVVIYHMNIATSCFGNNNLINSILAFIGGNGVHIFFVISGFIITTLLLKEKDKAGVINLKAFYIRRILRIIPPFAFYLIILFVLNQLHYLTLFPINFLYCSLFLSDFILQGSVTESTTWFFAHSWSLAVEEQYYLLFPPLMFWLYKSGVKKINILLVFLFLLSLVSLKLAKELSLHVLPDLIKLTTIFQFRYIIIGVILALNRNLIKGLIKNGKILYPICLKALVVVIKFTKVPSLLSPILDAAETISLGLFVLWFVENPSKSGLLKAKWVQWIGSCSYSIYLWQQLFTGKEYIYNGWTISDSPISIVPIMGCAAVSYYLIERPTIKLSKKISNNHTIKRDISVIVKNHELVKG